MYTSKFAKCSFVLALIVGGLFLFSEASFAQDITPPNAPVITLPRSDKIETGPVYFNWASTDDESGVVGYSYRLDGYDPTSPDYPVLDDIIEMDVLGLEGVTPQKRYKLSEGTYYFHVAAKNGAELWSDTAHFKVEVLPSALLVDDFEDTDVDRNSLGGDMWTGDIDGTGTAHYCNYTHTPVSSENVLQLDYKLTYLGYPTVAGAWAAYNTRLSIYPGGTPQYLDISGYQALSFWVKSNVSGKKFFIKVKDGEPEGTDPNPGSYTGDVSEIVIGHPQSPHLPGGVTTDWRRVIIPLYAFVPISGTGYAHGPITWSKMDNLSIVFEERIDSGSQGTIYINNIEVLTGVAPIDNFDAGRSLPAGWGETHSGHPAYPNDDKHPPYFLIADEAVDGKINVSYVSGANAHGGSGNSLKLTYTVPAPTPPATDVTAYCGFRYTFPVGVQGADISHFSTLGFYVKGDSGGERFNVHLSDKTGNNAYVQAMQYVTVRNDDWHYVAIPLEDFKFKGVDLKKIEALFIVFEWEAMSGAIYIDDIEFTNSLFKKPSTGPVKVEGRRLLVNGLPFTVRGVGYQPTPIGYWPYDTGEPGAQFVDVYADTPSNRLIWERDLALLREMGVNTIRTWSKVTSTAFLDACYNDGIDSIYVIMGFDIDPQNKNYNIFYGDKPDDPLQTRLENRTDYFDDFKAYVNAYKNHPAVLMWAIGNEVNYRYGGDVWWDPDDPHYESSKEAYLNPEEVRGVNAAGVITGGKRLTMREYYTLVDELARTAYEEEGEGYHPTMCPNGDLLYIGEQHYYIPTDPYFPDQVVRITDSAMNYLDMWGANVYRGNSFANNPYGIDTGLFNPSGLFKEYETRSAKPFVITEYGIDAYNNDTLGEYEATQASYAVGLWNEVMANPGSCVGASIMEYSDEWWKNDDPATVLAPNTQNTGGAPSPVGNPDEFSNEEWYGIMRISDNGANPDIVEPRPAYNDLSKKLAKELLVDDFNAPLDPDPEYPYDSAYDDTPPDESELVNRLGGEINVIEAAEPGEPKKSTVTLDYDESVRVGVEGYSLKIQYTIITPPAWAGFWTRFGPAGNEPNEPIDIRGFNTLSFWVKGAAGGEKFRVSLTPDGSEPDGLDHKQETKVSILDYLPEGVNTEWQQVSIPVSAFTKLEDRDKVEQFAIIFETHIQLWENGRWVAYPTGVTDTGAIYIEDLKFERKMVKSSISVDSFDDDIPMSGVEGNIWTYNDTGATISWDQDVSNPYSGTGCAYVSYEATPAAQAAFNIGLYGLDASYYDTLVFSVRGINGLVGEDSHSGFKVNVYLVDGILVQPTSDPASWYVNIINKQYVNLEDYVTITDKWQRVGIPLEDFNPDVIDLSHLQILQFVFEWENMSGTIFIDEIQFANYGEVAMPTLDPVPYIVNTSPIILSGTKAGEPETGIYINNEEACPVNADTTWSYSYPLVEGENRLRIVARDLRGAQSGAIEQIIILDPSAYLTTPPAGNISVKNDPENKGRNDSTINVSVANYPVEDAQHTGYQVEMCASSAFTLPYATYNYWHNSNTAATAEVIDENVNFDIDVNQFVGAGKVWSTLPSSVYVRVKAARNGFTPSNPSGSISVALSSQVLLEAPNSAALLNAEEDPIIKLVITPRSPRTSGKVIETGYRIDFLPGNESFATAGWDEMYHVYVSYNGISVGPLAYYIDMRNAVDEGVFDWRELSVNGVRARVASIKKGFTPSGTIFTSPATAPVKNITRLQNPAQGQVALANLDLDRVISFTINNYDPVNLGEPIDSIPVQHKMNTRHTGYRIDLCKDQNFNEGETYHYDYNYDFEGDSAADEIRAGLPGIGTPTKIRVDVDILSAASVLGYDFVTTSGLKRVYTRVLAIRDGYAVNYENYYKSSANFQNITRLQNPGSHLAVYNKEPANPADKMDRTITVEVENYNPSGVASGINKKNTKHTGYQIEISSSQSFAPVYTYTYLYIYDPENDGVPNEINATITDNIKIHIDLDVSRHGTTIGPPPGYGGPASNMVYVRALAYKAGYTLNYEDLPSTPLTVPFLDRTLLTKPVTVRTTNYANSNASYDIDSSIYVYIDKLTPTGLAHDGYDIKVDVVGKGANGKKYSKTYSLKGLELVSTDIPRQDKTIDVKKLFEVNNNPYKQYNLTGLLDIPANEIYGDEGPPAGTEDVKVTVVSTKEGYTSSASVQATEMSGGGAWTVLVFKNTSDTFLPSLSIVSASNPTGTTITVVLEGYSATSPVPPMGSGVGRVKYEIQCSTDSTFPDDKNVTITDSTADAQTTQTPKDIDVKTLSAIAQRTGDDPVSVYVRARFVKMSYTPKDYPEYPSPEVKTVTIDTLPPMIVDFTATPVAGQASMDVDFTSDVMGSVSSYSWDFGDETPAGTGASPSHTYSASGIYTVTLTATGPAGTDIYEKVDYIKVGDVAVTPGSSVQAAVDSASSGDNIVLIDGDHTGDITIDGKDVILVGASVHGTVIKGNILLKDSDSLIKNLTIRYDKGVEVPYGTDDYFKIVTDAGITAINSAIAVDSCVIMPDPNPEVFGTAKQGKGIQIWNLSGSAAVEPAIHNNLILNTDAGIYLYSHETGGAILGEVSNNTLDLNNYGITLRMYTENPAIHHNIITRSKDAIHEVYRDLISVRIGNITNNCFGAEAPSGLPEDSFDNERDVWYDEVQREVIVGLPWDTTGKGNIGVYPDFVGPYAPPTLSYDYTPQNPNCDGMGARLPAL